MRLRYAAVVASSSMRRASSSTRSAWSHGTSRTRVLSRCPVESEYCAAAAWAARMSAAIAHDCLHRLTIPAAPGRYVSVHTPQPGTGGPLQVADHCGARAQTPPRSSRLFPPRPRPPGESLDNVAIELRAYRRQRHAAYAELW